MSHALSPPRFRQDELNRRLCPSDEGDAFQRFIAELFESDDYPGIHVFPGRGKDGCIDLVWPPDSTSTVFECKTVEEDGLDAALRVWRGVASKLSEHLAAPNGPTSGQAQFRPWYRTDPPIREYVFCLSSLLANERQRQDLRDEIQGFFEGLATAHAHLRHLGSLRVLVRDWEDLSTRLAARPHLLFRWFPNARPRGLVVLGEETAGSRFSEYLTSARLPYYARREHLARQPAPAGREILDEEGLLASFEATGARGLVITGGGGFGKTRLMYELGRRAQASDWVVFRVQGSLRTEALENLAERLRPETPTLVLVDYIETQPAYGDWVETLEILADQRKVPLHYVACCRSSFYPSIQLIGRHQRVDLFPQTLDPETDRWLESFRESTVCHIAESTGLRSPERVVAMSRATPVLAVFAAWLHEQGREGDLDELLAEPDFGSWVHKRVRQSFQDVSVPRDLARFVALFPLPDGALAQLNDTQVRLLDTLAQDGWIEKVEQEEASLWEVVHDVLADQVMISYVATIPASAIQFVREILEEAARVGCVASALTALQRIGAHAVLTGLPWGDLIGSAMERHPAAWRPVRVLALQFALLDVASRVDLLSRAEGVWEGAEREVDFQSALGWMARVSAEEGVGESVRSSLTQWLRLAAPHVSQSNFLLTQGLRIDPAGLRETALDWLRRRPALFQTHYLLRGWLLAGQSASDVEDVVRAWLHRYSRAGHASFVLKAWLDAGGEKDLVRPHVSAWLTENATSPEARFVLKAWLNAGGEKDLVRSPVSAWLAENATSSKADFVLKAWLDAGGEPELVRSPVSAWLTENTISLEASFVLSAWLDASGEKDLVSSHVSAWLAENGLLPEAQFVLKAWLDAGGEPELVRPHVSAWLAENGLLPGAPFVFQAWLDAGGAPKLVRPHVPAWLGENGLVLEAGFVLEAWLDAGGEPDLVRSHVSAWLEKHSRTRGADFVMRAWLEARGDFDLVREPAILWLAEHRESLEAVYITKFLARQRDLPVETVQDVLTWCRCFPGETDSLWRLTSLNFHLHRGELAADLRHTFEVLAQEYLGAVASPPQAQALLAVLLAGLSRNAESRQAMHWLFLRWLRHPASLATLPLGGTRFPGRVREAAENPALAHFVVESFADGSLDNERDREILLRLFAWVATWSEENREGFRQILAARAGHTAVAPVQQKEEILE